MVTAFVGALALAASACGATQEETVATGEITTRKPFVSLLDRETVPYGPTGEQVYEVRVAMVDFGYEPEHIEVPVGATVRFVFENVGAVEHEAIVGDMAFQMAQHAPAEADADDHQDAAVDEHHDDEGAEDHEHDEGVAEDHHDDEGAEDHEHDEGVAEDHHDDEAVEDHDDEGMGEAHEDEGTAEDDHHDDEGTADEPSGGHDHEAHAGDAPHIALQPGKTGDLVVTFDTVGEFMLGCHIPGHWDAGMRARITVVEPGAGASA